MATADGDTITFAGYPPEEVLGRDSSRARSLRRLTPLATASTWLATFLGIAAGAVLLPELCPPQLRIYLSLMVFAALAVAVACWYASRWRDPDRQYNFFLVVPFLGVTIFAIVFALSPEGVPVVLVASLGIPLQSCHSLRRPALKVFMLYWTLVVVAAVCWALANDVAAAVTVPIALTVVPLTWLLVMISHDLGEDRAGTIDRNSLMTLRDSQTGLANRLGMAAVAEVMQQRSEFAGLALIDLDDFKRVNTLFGHSGGDRVIAAVADALDSEFGAEHLPVRLGGDEFVVILRGAGFTAAEQEDVRQRAARLIESIDVSEGELRLRLTASVGAAEHGVDGAGLGELLLLAEERLVAAKDALGQRGPVAQRGAKASPLPESDPDEGQSSGPVVAQPALMQRRALGAVLSPLLLLASMPLLGLSTLDSILLLIAVVFLPPAIAPNELPGIARSTPLRVSVGYLAYPLVGLAAYASGGALGPALPILVLLIGYDARDDEAGPMWWKLLLAELTAISPLLYTPTEPVAEFQLALGVSATFAVMLPVVLVLMVRNRRLLERARAESRRVASLDPLTGALNRRAFEAAVTRALVEFDQCAMVMIDLDNFKGVNTAEGYESGDALLGRLGAEFVSTIRSRRSPDLLGRVGGDEFAALLVDVHDLDLGATAQRFIAAVERETAGGSEAVRRVSASCGVALSPQHGQDFNALLRSADEMLMQVKAEGKSAARIRPSGSTDDAS